MATQPKNWWQRAIAAVKAAIDYLLSIVFSRPRAVRLKLRFSHSPRLFRYLEGKIMQVLTKEGSTVVVSAVDAQGLAAAVPTPTTWSAVGPFTVDAAADGLSAVVRPNGESGTGSITCVAGSLNVSEDLSFTSEVVEAPAATKLNLAFTKIAPPPPVVVG